MSFTFMPRRSTAIATGLVSAALVASLVSVESTGAASGQGPSAVAAKCGKKCKKRRAKNYLKGSLFTHITASPTGTSSSTERYAFCQNGTYFYRKDSDSIVAASTTTFDGTWSVKSATKSSAKVHYTTQNFQSVYFDGSPGPDSPPPAEGIVVIQAASESQAFIGGVEFTRSAGPC